MYSITVNIDWPKVHKVFSALDSVRHGTGIRVGYDGVTDAFGGPYFGAHYENLGLPGVVMLLTAQERITRHAWDVIHSATKWLPKFEKNGWLVECRDGTILSKVRTLRGAKMVASRRGGTVRYTADVIERSHDRARVAVRVMLAARDTWDVLVETGVVSKFAWNHIPMGCRNGLLLATGLHWLAGQASEDTPVTVEQAKRFADGMPIKQALGV